MTEYTCHWWPSGATPTRTPTVTLEAESRLQGAALALQRLTELGCDISAPLAHIDMIEPNGDKHLILVEEVLDWLNDPRQSLFVQREGLAALSRADAS